MKNALANRPTPEQLLVIHAALDETESALGSWRRWRETVEFDDVDTGSMRLLPMVYRNLGADSFDDRVVGRLKGLYRRSWSRNQILFKRAAEAIRTLERTGIETLVLKGASLSVLTYQDAGIRPMDDVDVLVPVDRAPEALEALEAAGWEAGKADPLGWMRVHHSLDLTGPGDGSIDLHWFTLWQSAADGPVWNDAVPLDLAGAETRAPCSADQLLLTCVHGTPWSPLPPFRWIADAVTLIRAVGDGMDWDRLASEAERRRLTVATVTALGYLAEEFAAPIPASTIERLGEAPASRRERNAFRAACRPDGPVRTFRMAWDRYRRLRDLGAGAPDPGGFVSYAQRFWGLDSPWRLPKHAATSFLKRVRVPGRFAA